MAAAPPAAAMPSGPPGPMLDVMRLLIDAGADLDAATVLGSPIEKAIDKRMPEAVKLLVESGASLTPSKHSPHKSLSEAATKRGMPELASYHEAAERNPPKKRTRKALVSPSDDPDVARLEKLCGSNASPLDGLDGAVTLHVNSSKKLKLEKVQSDFLKRGRFVFATNNDATRLAMLQTTDKYDAVAAMGTNGANYELSTQDIVAWLRALEKTDPFVLTGIGFDFLKGKFDARVSDPDGLSRKMYEFCPDIVDQGLETVRALRDQLGRSRELYFWWD
jgi:hypothetical protein